MNEGTDKLGERKAELAQRVKHLEGQLGKLIDHYKVFQQRSYDRHYSNDKWNAVTLALIVFLAVVYGAFLLYLMKRHA